MYSIYIYIEYRIGVLFEQMLTIHYSISGKITYKIKIYTSGHRRFIPLVTGDLFIRSPEFLWKPGWRMKVSSQELRRPEVYFSDIRHITAALLRALRAGMCNSKTKTNMQMT